MSRAIQLYNNIQSILEAITSISVIANLWHEYNQKYFNNRLITPNFQFMRNVSNPRTHAYYGYSIDAKINSIVPNSRIIKVSPRILNNEQFLKDTLLHEMCHQAVTDIDNILDGNHGPEWKRWMIRCGLEPNRTEDYPETRSEIEARAKRNNDYLDFMKGRSKLTSFNVYDDCCWQDRNGKLIIGRICAVPKNGLMVHVCYKNPKLCLCRVGKNLLYSVFNREAEELIYNIPDDIVDLVHDFAVYKRGDPRSNRAFQLLRPYI